MLPSFNLRSCDFLSCLSGFERYDYYDMRYDDTTVVGRDAGHIRESAILDLARNPLAVGGIKKK